MSYSEDVAKSLLLLSQSAKGLAEVTGEENKEASDIAKGLIMDMNSANLQSKISIFGKLMDRQMETEKDASIVYEEILKNRFEAGTMDEGPAKIALEKGQEEGLEIFGGAGIFSGGSARQIRKAFANNLKMQEEALIKNQTAYNSLLAKIPILGPDHYSIAEAKGQLEQQKQNMLDAIALVENVGQFRDDKSTGAAVATEIQGVLFDNEEELIQRANQYVRDIDSLLSGIS
tara:strand:+ start:7741 stop:8433 length:693 start_codon:yes stop_codon:yes gene_type:complete